MNIDRDRLHLLHIRDATEKILKYADDITFDEFAKKDKYYDAILMQIVVIGESVNNLSNSFKEKHNDLPWYEAVGLRNRIAHGYNDIKPDVVWQTIKEDLPELKNKIEEILK